MQNEPERRRNSHVGSSNSASETKEKLSLERKPAFLKANRSAGIKNAGEEAVEALTWPR
jgi:hypothetical protein